MTAMLYPSILLVLALGVLTVPAGVLHPEVSEDVQRRSAAHCR